METALPQQPPASEVTTKTGADVKQLFEVEKLKLEITDLKRSPWVKPAVMIPIVATLVTLGLSWALGVFDVERKRVEVSANLLEIRRAKLADDVTKLEKDQQNLEQAKADLRAQITELQKQLDYTKNVLSVPSLNLSSYSAFDGANLVLRNEGKGTARIQTIRVFVDNSLVSVAPGKEWIPALSRLGINAPWIHWVWPQDDYIGSGSTHILLEVPKGDFSYDRAGMFGEAVNHLGMEVCYCSDLGACRWTTYHRHPIELKACAVSPQ